MNYFIIVSGPTAVGKTDFVDSLGSLIEKPYEIINADVGQLYTPLSIGTAKPSYKTSSLKHYLFDVLDKPHSYTVSQWREAVVAIMHDSWSRDHIPVIVGGSSFYISSLFFPPRGMPQEALPVSWATKSSQELWDELYALDQTRAHALHPNDRYRIERALAIWHFQGKVPSSCQPHFEAPGTCSFYYLMRPKDELHRRIEHRVSAMMEHGWIDEVRSLDDEWIKFLLEKKLIGYPDIISYLQQKGACSYQELITTISRKTCSYAKRQVVFWRMLKKRLEHHDPDGNVIKNIVELHAMESSGNEFFGVETDKVRDTGDSL
ncbi:tRNA (adenosine(37)-N6)-dimethylallyltransferase MiaA [Candidatus Dependentiae bacterium]|nr:tRNA (adenosine(37)-N6)-dimethylallyltransferase MiaA [Candidatus Dependentiae bacterium]